MSSVRQLVKKFKDMPYNKRQGLVILGIVIVLISIPVTISLIRQNPQFTSKAATVAQFAGTPSSPEPFSLHPDYNNFDVQVHNRNNDEWADDALPSMEAQHGSDCSASADNSLFPTHEIHSYIDTVFICKNHLMTAIRTGGYAVIYLTPNKILDWSNGPAQFSFEVSTHITSARDWWDLWLQGYDGNTALPLEDYLPDLGNYPPRGPVFAGKPYLHIRCQGVGQCGYQNDQLNDTGPTSIYTHWQADSKATRDRFVLTIDRQKYSFCKVTGEPNGQPLCWTVDAPHSLGNMTQAIVQIGHHSYNPQKDCEYNPDLDCLPNTWHWSNIGNGVGDGPFIPFTILHSTKRAYDSGETVHFNTPAPANSFLRFAAIGAVTVNGQSYAPTQPDRTSGSGARSWWVPIAAGQQDFTINMTADDWYNGPFQARDFAIWSTTTDTGGGGGTTCTKQADLNCDGLVNILDMSILLSKWNTTDATADINQDGKVSVFDLSILLSKWGS